jgi:hypothetical protein
MKHSKIKEFISAWAFCAIALLTTPCFASVSLTSELSHAAGGAVMAGYISHLYAESENRAWIGFGISTALVIAEQSYEISKTGNRSSNQLDMAAHAIGSAIGAWYTDKYLLVPIVKRNSFGLTIYIPID